jgi:hypothetical protein
MVQQDLRVQQVLQDLQVLLEQLVQIALLLVQLDRLEVLDLRVHRDHKGLQVQQVHKAIQGYKVLREALVRLVQQEPTQRFQVPLDRRERLDLLALLEPREQTQQYLDLQVQREHKVRKESKV